MKYLLKSVAIFFVVTLLLSCNTLKQPKEVFVPIDYTEQDAINAEIQRINELKNDFPVMALWRSELLKDEQTIKENQENVFLLLQQAIEKKDFFSAVKYYVSLESVKYILCDISVAVQPQYLRCVVGREDSRGGKDRAYRKARKRCKI